MFPRYPGRGWIQQGPINPAAMVWRRSPIVVPPTNLTRALFALQPLQTLWPLCYPTNNLRQMPATGGCITECDGSRWSHRSKVPATFQFKTAAVAVRSERSLADQL